MRVGAATCGACACLELRVGQQQQGAPQLSTEIPGVQKWARSLECGNPRGWQIAALHTHGEADVCWAGGLKRPGPVHCSA